MAIAGRQLAPSPPEATARATVEDRRPGLGSPHHPEFKRRVLARLAARAAAGEDREPLVSELYDALRPWVDRVVAHGLAAVPPHADRAEVRSQIEEAVLLACRAIDFARWESWPSLLHRRVRMAPVEAARRDDWLTRRQRRYRKQYRARVEIREQELGRHLLESERLHLAEQVIPSNHRVNWAAELTSAAYSLSVAEPPDRAEDSPLADPESVIIRRAEAEIVTSWLNSLPAEVRDQLIAWLPAGMEHSRPLPQRLLRAVCPYVGALGRLLGED